MIATGVINLAGQIIGLFGQKGAAAQAQIKATAANMQRTYTDEVIVLYWFGPSIVSLFGLAEPMQQQLLMINADTGLLFEVQIGITAAVFGLGKLAGKK
jgi:hypothetical protein|tara:strand:- start:831 stop:1127 length:297 start_codon:yes stop_codon:yes gene_type:complete